MITRSVKRPHSASINVVNNPDDTITATAESLFGIDADTRIRNITLQLNWARLANVTLEQTAWLLLDTDPLFPPLEVVRSTASIHYRHAQLLNLLQAEVTACKLYPLKSIHPFFAPRFKLTRILELASGLGIYKEAADEILALSRQLPPKPEPDGTRARLVERMQWHREFVADYLPQHLSETHIRKIRPKTTAQRRRNIGSKVNVHLKMTWHEYDPAFTTFVAFQHGEPHYVINHKMLQEDRRALNIELQRGRPPSK